MSYGYGGAYPGGGSSRHGRTIIPFQGTQMDVLETLSTQQMRTRTIDQDFATAVFVNYVANKLQKGRSSYEAHLKLEDLERGLPQLSRSFHAARAQTGLPPSRIFPPLRDSSGSTISTGAGVRRAATTGSSPATVTQGPGVTAAANRRTQTVRPVEATPAEGDELPPPPYQRQDPEPEATAQLERQLSQLSSSNPPLTAPVVMTTGTGTSGGDNPQGLTSEERERQQFEEALRVSAEEAAGRSSEERLSRRVSQPPESSSGGIGIGGGSGGRPEVTHRRSVSDASRNNNPLHEEMGRLSIPGSFPEHPAETSSSSTANLVNLEGPIDPAAHTQPIQPIVTGSRNPFLNPVSPAISSPVNNPFSDNTETAGSSHTTVYSPPTGPPPPPSKYSPPSGPPPTTSTTSNGSSSSRQPPARSGSMSITRQLSLKTGKEDPLEMLRRYDTILLVDDSGSMAGSLWREAKNALIGLVEQAVEYDADGLDIHFINNDTVGEGLTSPAQVEELFGRVKPGGSTPTGMRLEKILGDYMRKLEQTRELERNGQLPRGEGVKPVNLIVITDGAPTDDLEGVLLHFAKRLDRGDYPLSQLGVQMLQIGNDPEAREALQELDDALASNNGVRDYIDTIPYPGKAMTADFVVKALLGGINRRLDRRN